jgi:selenocysteine lyase/cysteine desulfurase
MRHGHLDDDDTYFARLRAREFARLDASGVAYLDHAAAALYATSQLRAHRELLETQVLGNPHSLSAPSRASTDLVEAARARVLGWLGVDEQTHDVVFTANASAAVKLVGESYAFGARAGLTSTADNHNSVNGLRVLARRAGAPVRVLPPEGSPRPGEGGLLAFPAQSNFSGARLPLALVDAARASGMDVLLDAAAFLPTSRLDLRACPADFVVMSFYKLFGYPTGVGALVARRASLARLRRPWFAGGTVAHVSVARETHVLLDGHAGFEDGTPDFLAIAALGAGFDFLEEVGLERAAAHAGRLADGLRTGLRALGARIYGGGAGATVAFDVVGAQGDVVDFERVEAAARAAGVAIRGGCFCNPGAAEAVGRPRGCLRASIGMANQARDVDRLLEVVAASAATNRSACSP